MLSSKCPESPSQQTWVQPSARLEDVEARAIPREQGLFPPCLNSWVPSGFKEKATSSQKLGWEEWALSRGSESSRVPVHPAPPLFPSKPCFPSMKTVNLSYFHQS